MATRSSQRSAPPPPAPRRAQRGESDLPTAEAPEGWPIEPLAETLAVMLAFMKTTANDPVHVALRGRRRGRPPATPGLETAALALRTVYERKRQEFSDRRRGRGRRGGAAPSELAFAWMARRFHIGKRRLRQTLFSGKTGQAYRAHRGRARKLLQDLAVASEAEARKLLEDL